MPPSDNTSAQNNFESQQGEDMTFGIPEDVLADVREVMSYINTVGASATGQPQVVLPPGTSTKITDKREWENVLDPKLRRTIQNRAAQRRHAQRLEDAKAKLSQQLADLQSAIDAEERRRAELCARLLQAIQMFQHLCDLWTRLTGA